MPQYRGLCLLDFISFSRKSQFGLYKWVSPFHKASQESRSLHVVLLPSPKVLPFFAMSELHCYNSFIWKLQKWRRKGVPGQGNQCLNPSLLLTSHCLKHSHLAKCSYKEGRKFASIFVSHVPCLNFTKMHGGEWILWEWALSQPHQGNSEGFAK